MVRTVMKGCRKYSACLRMRDCPLYTSIRRVLDTYFAGEEDRIIDATRDVPDSERFDMRIYSKIQSENGRLSIGTVHLSGIKDSEEGGCVIDASADGSFSDLVGEVRRARDEAARKLSVPEVAERSRNP